MKRISSDRSDFPSDAVRAFGAAINANNQDAATAAYQGIKPYLAGVARTYCKSPADWPRFEQTALTALARASRQFDVERAKPIEHLVRVAVRNAALDEVRKRTARARTTDFVGLDVLTENGDLTDHVASPSEILIQAELKSHLAEQVRTWLENRRAREREFVRLHFFEGLSQAEIAERLHVSRAAISKLRSTILNRARIELRHVHEFLSVN